MHRALLAFAGLAACLALQGRLSYPLPKPPVEGGSLLQDIGPVVMGRTKHARLVLPRRSIPGELRSLRDLSSSCGCAQVVGMAWSEDGSRLTLDLDYTAGTEEGVVTTRIDVNSGGARRPFLRVAANHLPPFRTDCDTVVVSSLKAAEVEIALESGTNRAEVRGSTSNLSTILSTPKGRSQRLRVTSGSRRGTGFVEIGSASDAYSKLLLVSLDGKKVAPPQRITLFQQRGRLLADVVTVALSRPPSDVSKISMSVWPKSLGATAVSTTPRGIEARFRLSRPWKSGRRTFYLEVSGGGRHLTSTIVDVLVL